MEYDHILFFVLLSLSPLVGYALIRIAPEELRELQRPANMMYWCAFIGCILVTVFYTQMIFSIILAVICLAIGFFHQQKNTFWALALMTSVTHTLLYTMALVLLAGISSGVAYYDKKKTVYTQYHVPIGLFLILSAVLPFLLSYV